MPLRVVAPPPPDHNEHPSEAVLLSVGDRRLSTSQVGRAAGGGFTRSHVDDPGFQAFGIRQGQHPAAANFAIVWMRCKD